MKGSIGLLLLAAAGCKAAAEIPPSPDLGTVFQVRAETWHAKVTGKTQVPDPLGTETPDDQPSSKISLADDFEMGRATTGVYGLDAAVMIVGDSGRLKGVHLKVRRGRWESQDVLEEDLDLGTVVIPQGSTVQGRLLHEYYAFGYCERADFEGGVRTLATGGVGITRNTIRLEFPQGTERVADHGGIAWIEGEVEYAPADFMFLRGKVGMLIFIVAGWSVDVEVATGLRWGGVSLTAGYRQFWVQELNYSGVLFGLGIDF